MREHDALGAAGAPTGQEDHVLPVRCGFGLIQSSRRRTRDFGIEIQARGDLPRRSGDSEREDQFPGDLGRLVEVPGISQEDPRAEIRHHVAGLGQRERRIQRNEGCAQTGGGEEHIEGPQGNVGPRSHTVAEEDSLAGQDASRPVCAAIDVSESDGLLVQRRRDAAGGERSPRG